MHSCGSSPRWVVVSPQLLADGTAATVCIATCDEHVLSVRAYLADDPLAQVEPPVVIGLDAFLDEFDGQDGFHLSLLAAS